MNRLINLGCGPTLGFKTAIVIIRLRINAVLNSFFILPLEIFQIPLTFYCPEGLAGSFSLLYITISFTPFATPETNMMSWILFDCFVDVYIVLLKFRQIIFEFVCIFILTHIFSTFHHGNLQAYNKSRTAKKIVLVFVSHVLREKCQLLQRRLLIKLSTLAPFVGLSLL